ncbi:MAG: iron-containing alcohol dehydrogenase [bacterium]
MDALIPAAGRGARLDRPDTPKPLVEVDGVPLIVRTLRQLQAAGVTRAVIVTGHGAARVEAGVRAARELHLRLEFVFNPAWSLGLAGSIRAAAGHLPGPFLLAMGDHIYDPPLIARMAAAPVEPDGVVALVDHAPERVFDPQDAVKVRLAGGRPTRFVRHGAGEAIDAGLFLATPALFEALADCAGDDLAQGVDALARAGRVRALACGAAGWDDVDTPASLVHAELRLREARRRAGVTAAGPGADAAFRFETGRPIQTEVVIERGAVARPEAAGLVPERSASSPVFVFTDETVHRLYGEAFIARLQAAGYRVHGIVMPDGEESKTVANFAHVVERVLARGIDERSVLISLGGGVVCNVCGFVASTLYRGVELVHVPTTLMAQADAAISHKQAVNGARGKNMVGAYYAPRRIVVDVDVLQTQTDRALRDGLAEVIKHALAQDAALAGWLLAQDPAALREAAFLEAVVRRTIGLKCALMATDPQEHREGLVLQYGHTVGHPLEHLSGYALTHGEAVGLGMRVAVRVARQLGACDDATVAAHDALIAHFGLPSDVPAGIRTEDVLEALVWNKKYLVEGTRMALVDRVGNLWNVNGNFAIPVPDALIARAVEACRGGQHGERGDHRSGERHRAGVRRVVRRRGQADLRRGAPAGAPGAAPRRPG